MNRKFIFFACFILFFGTAKTSPVFNFTSFNNSVHLGNYVEFFEDSTAEMSPSEILRKGIFLPNKKITPLFPISSNAVWIKFSVLNNTNDPGIFLLIQNANISKIELYKDSAGTMVPLGFGGNSLVASNQLFNNPNYVFDLHLKPADTQAYYLRVTSFHPKLLPIVLGELGDIENTLHTQTSIVNLYLGIILAIFLYNLFLFISTFDRTYFYYILFIGLLGLAQLTISGYSFFYLWSNFPELNRIAVPVTTCLAGIGTGMFTISFLRTKTYTPIIHILFIVIICIYITSALFSIAGYNKISYDVFNYTNLAAAIVSITVSYYIAKKGYRPAYFYFISFIAFSICLIIREMRNINILPDNNFTSYILYIGSAIQAILLSFALADKINSLRIEKEASQTYALKISQENEKLIREQNIVLEQKVAERTDELQQTNTQLNKTLGDLKDAQMQLVEAEKMASLGQLTAGIAHEINNPINFVKSNIRPLQLDIDDLFEIIDQYNTLHDTGKDKLEAELENVYAKQQSLGMDYVRTEIQQLIKGIEDGAERTAEIVRGLRTFSRLDESELKVASVHDGIDSTIVLLRNSMPPHIRIERNFKADANIECFPGKLNQVFMNILNNAIQAVAEKKVSDAEGIIFISTSDNPDKTLKVIIRDTGIGMSEEVKHRIFEPFFTTKPVGEGTGLGMAIVFKIIQEHHGKIDLLSEPGKGTEFIITLPYIHPGN